MSTTWIIADTHFGKQPKDRVKAAGITSYELDRKIADMWQGLVDSKDNVWHLGDTGDLALIKCLPGVKRLIRGNDDKQRDCVASGAFADVMLRYLVDGIQLVHRPQDATVNGPVFHGHLHALSDPRPNFLCLSVDQTNFMPIRWTEAVGRLIDRQVENQSA